MLSFIGIIPARYASTRFPGKPLADIKGKTMIHRVYEKVVKVLDNVVVATDDERIFSEVKGFGGKVIMTSDKHKSGTDRCFEALEKYSVQSGKTFDVVVNIQGDEPFIKSEQIDLLKACFKNEQIDIATLVKQIDNNDVIFDANRPKVVRKANGEALYFSRSAIPYCRSVAQDDWVTESTFFQHIGIYAYKTKVLGDIVKLPQSPLEKAESLEQLRWLENGYRIMTAVTEHESMGIDTPEDLTRAVKML